MNPGVENGHRSIHYIQKVALSWSDSGITSVEHARQHSSAYNKNCYTVLNAFVLRTEDPQQLNFLILRNGRRNSALLSDIIQEACSRTITATHQPSFEYADSILTKWNENQVIHLKDIAVLDAAFQKEKSSRKSSDSRQKPVTKNLNNFERRAYDMESLEEQLLNSN